MSTSVRLNKFVAGATGLSRRAADTAIASGRVKIGGRVASLGEAVKAADSVTLDDRPLSLPAAHHYVILHKPAGYVSSRTRQGTDPTLYSLLPPELRHLRIAGRLDRDSSGLILLSDDGGFVNRYTHPSFGKAKTYELTLARPLTPADRARLEAGVDLADGPSRLQVLSAQGKHCSVQLSEGRNRQIRRTLGALGYTVERLHRTSIGPYRLDQLAPGGWREVSAL